MTDLPNSEADAKAQLRAAMRYDTDLRWQDRPILLPDPKKRSALWYSIAGAIVMVGCISILRGLTQ